MSKSALCLLMIALLACVVNFLLPAGSESLNTLFKCIASLTGVLFVVALFIGRRIKFDPVLR